MTRPPIAVIASAAKQSTCPQSKSGLLRRFAPRNDAGCKAESKRRAGGPPSHKSISDNAGVPGRSEAPPGPEGYFLDFFFDFDFFAFFAFFAFLAIVSSQGFNGWKRDTRHARRRASLATSSKVIPTDSRRAAPRCHVGVIALSTADMRFDAFFAARRASSRKFLARRGRSRRLGRVNDAPTLRRILDRSGTAARRLHHFKTTARICSAAVTLR